MTLTVTDVSTNVVSKSNTLINSIYSLSVQEQRIVLFLISLINPKEDKGFKKFQIPIDVFKKIIGAEGEGYYKELDSITSKLMTRTFRVDYKDGSFLKINWLASCYYKKGEGKIELEISQYMTPYLLDLKSHYTTYRLKNILPLRSGYSIRLYELLKQYETVGERYMTLDELRQKMEIPSDEYRLYADFKRKVILHTQKELQKKTDLFFEFKEKKHVRRVIGIYFFIVPNVPKDDKEIEMVMAENTAVPKSDAIQSMNVDLYQRLLKVGITTDQAKALMSKYDETRLAANLDYAEFKIQQGNVENKAAYVTTIIKNDVRQQASLFEEQAPEKPVVQLQPGMKIDVGGTAYTIEEGCVVRTPKGVITSGDIRQGIADGFMKIIEKN